MRSTGDLPSQEKARDEFPDLLDLKAPELLVYSPFSFLHKADSTELCRETFTDPLKRDLAGGSRSICHRD